MAQTPLQEALPVDTVPRSEAPEGEAGGLEAPEAPTSLVQGTQLVKAYVKVFPTCGESVIVVGTPTQPEHVEKGSGEDPEATAARSARRRRGKVRRYLIHNKLHRLWTLTYAEAEWDYDQVKADLARFFRDLRTHRRKRFPYLWVIERHPKGHGLHVHVAMEGYVRKRDLQAIWGRGIVHFSDKRKRASEAYSGAQLAAYFAKELAAYITKEAAATDGQHFYDCAQGYQPPEVCEFVQGDEGAIIRHVSVKHFGSELPLRTWHSSELEDWDGPPVILCYWYGST